MAVLPSANFFREVLGFGGEGDLGFWASANFFREGQDTDTHELQSKLPKGGSIGDYLGDCCRGY